MTENNVARFSALARSPYVLAGLLLAVALLVRMIGLSDAPPRTDDLYNFIAARSWVENGTLAMADGFYTRARYYSIVTAWFMEFFGPTLGVARSVAAIGGALLVPILALWVRKVSDPVAAWSAGILLCFSYTCITWAQIVRFYSWHAVAMLVLAIAVYELATGFGNRRPERLVIWAGAALIALLIGLYLQPITVIIVVALAIWTGLYCFFSGRLNFILRSPTLLWGAVAAIAVAMALAFTFGRHLLLSQWYSLRNASDWSTENQDNFIFYIDQFQHQLGWLFLLFPIALIIAWRRYRTATGFCVAVLAICLILHSIAGMKALRYVMYLFPFIFAVWGMALSAILGHIRSRSGQTRQLLGCAVLVLVGAASLLLTTDFRQTAAAGLRLAKTGNAFLPFEYGFGRDQVDWTPYLPALQALRKEGLFVVSDSNRAIYYLDDYDLLLSKTELSDVSDREFALDERTGKRDIGSGRSIAQVIACYPKGVVLTTQAQWRSAYVAPDAADVIEREAKPVLLPPQSYLRAYRWNRSVADRSPDCQRLYRMIGKGPNAVSG